VRIRIASSALLLLLVTSGCLPIPHRHTRQAGARFVVTDSAHRVVRGAVVRAYEGSVIGGSLRQLDSAITDSTGRAELARRRIWHPIVILIPDAEAPSVYGWCVEAAGYAAAGHAMEDESHQTISASLRSSVQPSHCPETVDQDALQHGEVQADSR